MNRGVLAGLGPGDSPDVLTGDAGQNAVLIAGNRKEVAFSIATTNTASSVTDCSDYRYVSVHILAFSTGSPTILFQGSNDGVNWLGVELGQPTGNVNLALSTSGSASMYVGPVPCRYFRLLVTGTVTSGACTGVMEFFSQPPTSTNQRVVVGGTVAISLGTGVNAVDGQTGSTGLPIYGQNMGYTGLGGGSGVWNPLRTPTFFKTATATVAGDTALWTPAAGKKFRLMRYQIEVTNNAATAGGAAVDIVLRDGTTATPHASSVYVPAAGGTVLGSYTTGWVDVGNGPLSAAINTVLNINLSAALTAGKVRVVACGTEE